MAKLPLEGIRCIDNSTIWAGPWCATILGDLGAEVIRVESPNYFPPATRGVAPRPIPRVDQKYDGYPYNIPGERPFNRAAGFNAVNRNKLGMTIDFRKPSGREVFKRLVAISDVFTDNNAAGTFDDFGLGWDELSKVNPRLIRLSLPGFGNTGPYRDYMGFGYILECMVGHTWLRGYEDSAPATNTLTFPADTVGAATAAYAVLVALVERERTGKGQFIDMSQAEAFVPHLGQALMQYVLNGRVEGTSGNHDPHRSMAPHGVYRCMGLDRWVTITVENDDQWKALCQVMGNPEWTRDPKFGDVVSRWKNQNELDKLIEQWTMRNSDFAIMHMLQRAGVPAGAVMDTRDIYFDPHLEERGFFEWADHPEAGRFRYPGAVAKFSETPVGIRYAAPCLGQHNEYVYKKLLGYSDAEYEQLKKEGHISTVYTIGQV